MQSGSAGFKHSAASSASSGIHDTGIAELGAGGTVNTGIHSGTGAAHHSEASSSSLASDSGIPGRVSGHPTSSSSSSSSQPARPSSGSPEALDYALRTGDASVVTAKQVTAAALAYLRSPSASPVSWLPPGGEFNTLLERLDTGSFSTTWSGCKVSYARVDNIVQCHGDAAYMNEFDVQAMLIRKRLRELDELGTRIFGDPAYRIEQFLVLLGDTYRQDVSYGEHFTKESDKKAFLRALYSDAASYMSRNYNLVAKNLGTFSNTFPDTMATIERELHVPMPAKARLDEQGHAVECRHCEGELWLGHPAYATGLYVLPGRSVTLTRTDTGSGEVRFGVNMLRDTTHAFNQLDRPTQLASPRPLLRPNTPVTITNPYGGPLFLFISPTPGQAEVSVKVSGVITHPVLRKPEDPAAVQVFQQEVESTPTNWVFMTTDMVTLQTTLEKFRKALARDYDKDLDDTNTPEFSGKDWINYHGDLQQFARDTWTYFVKIPFELAGFSSASGKFSLAPSVKAFCDAKGWDCSGEQHRRSSTQHVIADLPLAGGGTAGNPYDQYEPFSPLGWTESHEVGHGLQRDRIAIYGDRSNETSNNIFPLYKLIRYNQNAGAMQLFPRLSTVVGEQPKYCPDVDEPLSECLFNILKQAKSSGQARLVYDAVWSDPGQHKNDPERVVFYRQLVEFARYYNTDKFKDGWELYTLLYLLDRNLDVSRNDWATVRDKFGFSTYEAYPEGKSLDGNDFMLVATSFIIGRDMRPVFDLWDITYSQAAAEQVKAYRFQPAAEFFFPMKNLASYGDQVLPPVQVTSTSVYPNLPRLVVPAILREAVARSRGQG